jgi:hypothetical protein
MTISTFRKSLTVCCSVFIFLLPAFVSHAQCFIDALKYNRPQQQFTTLPDNTVASLTSDFTIESWIYPTSSLSFLQSESVFSFGNSTSDFMTLALFSGNNSPVFSLDVGGTEDDIITNKKVTINTWHHLAVVSLGGTVTLYLDGVAIGSTTLENTPSALGGGSGTIDDWLGKSEFSSDPYFSGYMDEFRVSDVARYTANFTPPASAFTPDASTLDLYHFDNGSGQIVSDASGNGNDATLGATSAVETSDPTWQSCSTLPIFLTQFSAAFQNNEVHLQWTAYKDFNPGSFQIEHSTDGSNFSPIGSVQANELEGTFNYQFDDTHPANGNNFYRLLMIETGSVNMYSNILLVSVNGVAQFSVFPTMANSSITVQLANPADIKIIDAAGATIKQVHLAQSQVIDISSFAKGFYFLINKTTAQVVRFIKN